MSIFIVFLKNKNIIFKIRRSQVTEYAALNRWTSSNNAKIGLWNDKDI